MLKQFIAMLKQDIIAFGSRHLLVPFHCNYFQHVESNAKVCEDVTANMRNNNTTMHRTEVT
jgi:hypothetical protein